jgi:recombination protein RecT
MSSETGMVSVHEKAGKLRNFLTDSRVKDQIGMACTAGLKVDKVIRTTMTLVQSTPALLDCSQASILAGIVKATELGLELTGAMGHAYLIPYINKGVPTANFQLGYRGLMELAHRSDKIVRFDARIVYANDEFSIDYSQNPPFKHKPCLHGEAGEIIGVYSSAFLRGGATDIEYMTVQQIMEHRDKYSKAGASSPWATAFAEMAKKTVIKRLAKRLPLSTDIQVAIDEDDQPFYGVAFSQAPDNLLENNSDKTENAARKSTGTSKLKNALASALAPKEQPAE